MGQHARHTFKSDAWVNFVIQKYACLIFGFALLNNILILQVFPTAAVEVGVEPASWYDLGISYASAFEVLLVSLALVYYASDMPNGKSILIDYCKEIVND